MRPSPSSAPEFLGWILGWPEARPLGAGTAVRLGMSPTLIGSRDTVLRAIPLQRVTGVRHRRCRPRPLLPFGGDVALLHEVAAPPQSSTIEVLPDVSTEWTTAGWQ